MCWSLESSHYGPIAADVHASPQSLHPSSGVFVLINPNLLWLSFSDFTNCLC